MTESSIDGRSIIDDCQSVYTNRFIDHFQSVCRSHQSVHRSSVCRSLILPLCLTLDLSSQPSPIKSTRLDWNSTNSDVSLLLYALGICVYAGSDVVPLSKILAFFTGAESVPPLGLDLSPVCPKECSPHHQPVHSTLHYRHSTTISQLFSKKKCCITMGKR